VLVADFTPEELVQIGDLMMEQLQYKFDDDARDALEEYIMRRLERPRFAYGRSIRNAIDRARMCQAGRLYGNRDNLTKEDLMTIKLRISFRARCSATKKASLRATTTGRPTARSRRRPPAATRASSGAT
jgi:AAA lid domain